jgi:hypothetical protein
MHNIMGVSLIKINHLIEIIFWKQNIPKNKINISYCSAPYVLLKEWLQIYYDTGSPISSYISDKSLKKNPV